MGPRGPTGATGGLGRAGRPGLPGDRGEPGGRGITGATGFEGPIGPGGPRGPNGPPGMTGSTGKELCCVVFAAIITFIMHSGVVIICSIWSSILSKVPVFADGTCVLHLIGHYVIETEVLMYTVTRA